MSDLKEFQRFEQRPFVGERNVSFSYEGPLLGTLEFIEISHGSYQPLNFVPFSIALLRLTPDDLTRQVETCRSERFITVTVDARYWCS